MLIPLLCSLLVGSSGALCSFLSVGRCSKGRLGQRVAGTANLASLANSSGPLG